MLKVFAVVMDITGTVLFSAPHPGSLGDCNARAAKVLAIQGDIIARFPNANLPRLDLICIEAKKLPKRYSVTRSSK